MKLKFTLELTAEQAANYEAAAKIVQEKGLPLEAQTILQISTSCITKRPVDKIVNELLKAVKSLASTPKVASAKTNTAKG